MGAELPLPAIRSQISAAIDIMVHLGRLRDKSRKVLSIVEVGDYTNGEILLNPIYQFEEEVQNNIRKNKRIKDAPVEGYLKKVGELQATQKLCSAGCTL